MPAGVSAKRVEQALRYEADLCKGMEKILTMSEVHRQSFIRNFGLDEARVVNVGCAANMSELPRVSPGKQYDKQEILFVGSDFQRKGGAVLLAALAPVRQRYPRVRLHIVGPRQLAVPQGLDRLCNSSWLSK